MTTGPLLKAARPGNSSLNHSAFVPFGVCHDANDKTRRRVIYLVALPSDRTNFERAPFFVVADEEDSFEDINFIQIPLVGVVLELLLGLYAHYKGPLYQVFGYGIDANHPERGLVVIYMGTQLEAAHTGPRLAVRTARDFFALVCPSTSCQQRGKVVKDKGPCPHCHTSSVLRFTFQGVDFLGFENITFPADITAEALREYILQVSASIAPQTPAQAWLVDLATRSVDALVVLAFDRLIEAAEAERKGHLSATDDIGATEADTRAKALYVQRMLALSRAPLIMGTAR